MSLRGKIVLLFLCLAVAPLLVVAGFGYWQASKLAREVVAVALDASINQTAGQLHQGTTAVEEKVRALASPEEIHRVIGDPDFRDRWELRVAADLAPLSYVAVRVPGGDPIAEAGTRPDGTERCTTTTGGARLYVVRRAVRADGQDVEVEAGVWIDDLVAREPSEVGGSLLVFQRTQGTVWLSTSCEELEAGAPPALFEVGRRASAAGHFRFEWDGAERLAAFVPLQSQPWTVAAYSRTDTFLAPLNRLQASYWIFVMMLALATVLAFSLLLDRVVMSLEDLTRAAEKIGEGELNPWLPPPGTDEVGRLSLAFSGMLERIRQMMQRVDHSGRLAVVGQLASYLAHEIRNPLSSIRMNLQSLQRDVRQGRIPESSGEAIDISLREVDRLSGSLTSVLQLGRPLSGEKETVSVHDLVEDAAALLAGEFRRTGVELHLELDAAADRISGVPGQLKGVFVNLMMNALEAQPKGGWLEIRSRLESGSGRGPVVAVHLRDHGRGIAPQMRNRIFEPFFTTKSQGSGIGLAVALRTVREHGGDVFLAELPETAAGSEFVVELPLAAVATEHTAEPAVDLPAWMDQKDGDEKSKGPVRVDGERHRGRQGPVRDVDEARLRALMMLSNPDQGELH